MQTNENRDLAVVEKKNLLPKLAASDQIQQFEVDVQNVIRALKSGVDYGKIGNTKSEVLLKPGAERLLTFFNLHAVFDVVDKEIDHDRENKYNDRYKGNSTSFGFYRYVVSCTVYDSNGRRVANALGSCSTMESKYISRPRDVENTVLKMAEKRAMVAAALHAFSLSNRFTQDIEDMSYAAPKNATPRQTTKKPIEVFDLDSTQHQERLKTILESRSVPEDRWEEFAVAMVGKEMSQKSVIGISKDLGV